MSFKDKKQLPEQIAQHLAEKIIHLELKPGEKLLEEKLANELGVSRSPVREAFYILNQWYLVDLVPRRGTFVAEMSDRHIIWLYDILGAIYPLILKKAPENFLPEDFKNIEDILKKMEERAADSDIEHFHKGIFEYASIFVKAAGNPLIEKTLRGLWPSKMRIEYAILRHRRNNLPANILAFRKAAMYFKEGKIKMAEKTLLQYLMEERAAVLQYLKEINISRIA